MPRQPKKSKYKSVVIKKKRYYFYEILWEDITADGGHATAFEFMGFLPSKMITRAYVFEKDHKYVRTFASYEVNEELFSDRKKLMAHLAQAKIKLLSLVYLANRCAKGVGTAWHSSVFGVRAPFCFFKNFFAQKFYL